MRGLTLTQPWATLVAIGAKQIETRSWSTNYRGELLIHAAKGFPRECQALCWRSPFADALIAHGFDRVEKLPVGQVVAYARLDAVVPTDDMLFVWQHYGGKAGFEDAAREQAFGDYSANRFAWKLTDVKRVPHPFPCKGALGLWSVPQIVLDLIAGQGVL